MYSDDRFAFKYVGKVSSRHYRLIAKTEQTMELTQKQIGYCMECGVCTGSCPVSRVLPRFSPRQMVKRAMEEPNGDFIRTQEIWACLSCERCSNRSPVEIDFPEYIR